MWEFNNGEQTQRKPRSLVIIRSPQLLFYKIKSKKGDKYMTITMSNGRIQYDREAAGKLKGQSHELRMRDFLPRSTISFPEPTCLLVSTKTRSSGIINKLVPRALVFLAFKISYCCSFKAKFRLS